MKIKRGRGGWRRRKKKASWKTMGEFYFLRTHAATWLDTGCKKLMTGPRKQFSPFSHTIHVGFWMKLSLAQRIFDFAQRSFTILYFNYYIFSFIMNNLFDYIINEWLTNLIKYMIWIHNIEIKFSINLNMFIINNIYIYILIYIYIYVIILITIKIYLMNKFYIINIYWITV